MPNPPRYTGTDGCAYIQPAPTRGRQLPQALQRAPGAAQQRYPAGDNWSQLQDYYIRYYTYIDPWTHYQRQLGASLPPQEEQPMFNIGDSVYYYSEISNKKFYGIVKTQSRDFTIGVAFEQDFKDHYGYREPIYHIGKGFIEHGSREPALPTEIKVANKCKKLWNNSNYVKNNPQLAY